MAVPERLVIVGGGMAGDAAAKAARRAAPDALIQVVGAEPRPPYRRPHLSKRLWSEDGDSGLDLGTAKHADIVTGVRARSIDLESACIELEDGSSRGFDALLIATGAEPRRLPSLEPSTSVLTFRDVGDYERLRSLSGAERTVLVVGGGFLGAELAAGLRRVGTDVHMAFPEPSIGAARFPAELGDHVTGRYRREGVVVHSGVTVDSGTTSGETTTVLLSNGKKIEAHAVVVCVGAKPDPELAVRSGLAFDRGIVVDENMRVIDSGGSAVDRVFAAGDVASFPWGDPFGRRTVEHEDAAVTMGAHAGRQMVRAVRGEPLVEYSHLPFFYSDMFDLGYEAVGRLDAQLDTFADWRRRLEEGVVYYLEKDRVVGVLLWNVWGEVDAARDLIGSRASFTPAELVGSIGA